ncbi:hypothetical protein KBI52_04590 [Microvirga sp. HBU67558]|uniref:hypothetical protein n=1 Tax=Microvirga TaxID=186650 RepID=UPI001B37557F|nr:MULTISPECIES: hypothetical protein [unclassified Microvirga]MBQ0819501.1 hypothetical protein [Microvirga sp. HBU67558]
MGSDDLLERAEKAMKAKALLRQRLKASQERSLEEVARLEDNIGYARDTAQQSRTRLHLLGLTWPPSPDPIIRKRPPA